MNEDVNKDYSKEAEKVVKKTVKAFTDAAFESLTIDERYRFAICYSSYLDFEIFKFEGVDNPVIYFQSVIMCHEYLRHPIFEKWQYKALVIKCNIIIEAIKKYRAENRKIKKQKS